MCHVVLSMLAAKHVANVNTGRAEFLKQFCCCLLQEPVSCPHSSLSQVASQTQFEAGACPEPHVISVALSEIGQVTPCLVLTSAQPSAILPCGTSTTRWVLVHGAAMKLTTCISSAGCHPAKGRPAAFLSALIVVWQQLHQSDT